MDDRSPDIIYIIYLQNIEMICSKYLKITPMSASGLGAVDAVGAGAGELVWRRVVLSFLLQWKTAELDTGSRSACRPLFFVAMEDYRVEWEVAVPIDLLAAA